MHEILSILHKIGLLMTVGVITASLVYGWYKKLSPNTKLQFPYKWISPSVKAGLFILIVSGLGMYSLDAKTYNASETFWIKMIFVMGIILNNIWLNGTLKPKSRQLSADPASANSPELQKIKRRIQFAENLSLFLWYSTTIVSFLLPEGVEGSINGSREEEGIF